MDFNLIEIDLGITQRTGRLLKVFQNYLGVCFIHAPLDFFDIIVVSISGEC